MQKQTPLKQMIKDLNYQVSNDSFDYIENLIELQAFLPNYNDFQPIPYNNTLIKAIKESEEFMRNYFNIHNIEYLDIDCIHSINPYKIPIIKKDEDNGCSEVHAIYTSDIYGIKKIFYTHISIIKYLNEFTSSTITHEITHTQQETDKGMVNYFNNIEVLPILLEIIHYYESHTLKVNQKRIILIRLKSLQRYINTIKNLYDNFLFLNKVAPKDFHDDFLEERVILFNKYIDSTLKALSLFDIYLNSNDKVRKEIFKYIQNIFDAKTSVEEFLEYYDTTFESSIDSLQKVLKSNIFK